MNVEYNTFLPYLVWFLAGLFIVLTMLYIIINKKHKKLSTRCMALERNLDHIINDIETWLKKRGKLINRDHVSGTIIYRLNSGQIVKFNVFTDKFEYVSIDGVVRLPSSLFSLPEYNPTVEEDT
jgi:hypothetical protein